jgi:hypothetical protein
MRKNNGLPITLRSTGAGNVVVQLDATGGDRFSFSMPIAVGVDPPRAPAASLGQNVPNPFNPVTRIPFALQSRTRVRLDIHDVRGARLATLIDDDLAAGTHDVQWSGRDDRGRPVASGVYFYTLTAGGETHSRKMMLLK